MDKFDLLKSHVEAFTRKNGSSVAAHDTKVQAAYHSAERATEATTGAYGRPRFKKPPTTSHGDAAAVHNKAAIAHGLAADSFRQTGDDSKAYQFDNLADFHASLARTHKHLHETSPNGVPDRLKS